MTNKTKLRIGSVAKVITSAALMRLYEQQKIDFDVDVKSLVKSWPKNTPRINLAQLTNHTSGIRHYRGQEFLSNKEFKTTTDALAIFKNDELLFSPGSRFSYSTYAWTLVSAVMERADGQRDFKTIVNDEVLKPLNLKGTTFDDTSPIIEYRHTPYSYAGGQLFNSPAVNSSYKYAGGGFLSTPSDVVTFAMAHVEPGYLDKLSLEKMFTSTAKGRGSNFGIGWLVGFETYLSRLERDKEANKDYIRIVREHPDSVMHSGGSMGGTTMLILCLEHKHSVAVVKNVSGETSANVFKLALKTLDIF